jgi:uncharacterized membrane protein YfcA
MDFYLVVAVVGLLIGLSKGGMGAVLVILVTPLLTLVMPTADAVSLSLPLLIFADVLALYVYWNQWDMRYVRLMLPSAILGIAVGTLLLATLPDLTLRRLLGIFTLIFIGYRLLSTRLLAIRYQPQNWHGYAAGAASGLGSALANTGSPPFTAYMLLQGISPEVFAATTTLFFAIVNLLKLPAQVVAGIMHFDRVLATLWVLPLIVAGVWLGRWMIRRINQPAFERLLLVLLAVASFVLILLPPAR